MNKILQEPDWPFVSVFCLIFSDIKILFLGLSFILLYESILLAEETIVNPLQIHFFFFVF